MCLMSLDNLRVDGNECYSFHINYMNIGWLKQRNLEEGESIPTIIGEAILDQITSELNRKNE